tara:strand:+ start:181 stop:1044 length:864 start_codon:yes stop_codon:yes gene_type:complete
MGKNYLNTKQVASLFSVDNSTIRRWTLSNKLECTSSNGGHRKFSYKQILDFINSHNKKLNLNLSQINTISNKNSISSNINFIIESAFNRNSNEIESLLLRLYLEGKKINYIFDKYIDKSLDSIQTLLDSDEISVAEEHIARKTISKSLNSFRDVVKKNKATSSTALCLNLENDVPDLAIDMIQIILESFNYSVHNSGSHTSVENISSLIAKNKYDAIYIYMCSRQCCTATVKDHIANTLKSLEQISSLCHKHSIDLFVGGPATKYVDEKMKLDYTKFLTFTDMLDFI